MLSRFDIINSLFQALGCVVWLSNVYHIGMNHSIQVSPSTANCYNHNLSKMHALIG